MSSSASRALSSFRRLMRARQKLFAGDSYALMSSRLELRKEFLKNKNANGKELEELLMGVNEVEDMMLHGILQGKVDEVSNTVQVRVMPEHTTKEGKDTEGGIEVTQTKRPNS